MIKIEHLHNRACFYDQNRTFSKSRGKNFQKWNIFSLEKKYPGFNVSFFTRKIRPFAWIALFNKILETLLTIRFLVVLIVDSRKCFSDSIRFSGGSPWKLWCGFSRTVNQSAIWRNRPADRSLLRMRKMRNVLTLWTTIVSERWRIHWLQPKVASFLPIAERSTSSALRQIKRPLLWWAFNRRIWRFHRQQFGTTSSLNSFPKWLQTGRFGFSSIGRIAITMAVRN